MVYLTVLSDDNIRYWVIPVLCFFAVGLFVIMAGDVRANTPEREIPIIIINKTVSAGNPYILHCDPSTEFAPVWKIIQNSTHKFDHVLCQWEDRN